jgi:hypothetical protein
MTNVCKICYSDLSWCIVQAFPILNCIHTYRIDYKISWSTLTIDTSKFLVECIIPGPKGPYTYVNLADHPPGLVQGGLKMPFGTRFDETFGFGTWRSTMKKSQPSNYFESRINFPKFVLVTDGAVRSLMENPIAFSPVWVSFLLLRFSPLTIITVL